MLIQEIENQSAPTLAHVNQASETTSPSTSQLTSRHYSECVEKRGLNAQWVAVNCCSATANVATQRLGYAAIALLSL